MPLSKNAIEFLKIQYKLGRVTEERLDDLVERGEITSEDKNYIIGKEE